MGKLLRGAGWTLGALVVLGGIARLTIVDVWRIPEEDARFGVSLEPTLSAGDTVLLMRRFEPGFGDLVRCPDPDDATRFVVGRIVGVAGDTVEVNGRELLVDGKRYQGEMACAIEQVTITHPVSGEKVVLGCDQVQMGGRIHMRGYSGKHELTTPAKATVGMGMVYLLSDDRTYHDDSRDFGVVPLASCKSRVFFRLWGASGWGDDKRRLVYIK